MGPRHGVFQANPVALAEAAFLLAADVRKDREKPFENLTKRRAPLEGLGDSRIVIDNGRRVGNHEDRRMDGILKMRRAVIDGSGKAPGRALIDH